MALKWCNMIEDKLTLGREATMNELRSKIKELEGKLKEKRTKNNNIGS